jgi:hypothetical protein
LREFGTTRLPDEAVAKVRRLSDEERDYAAAMKLIVSGLRLNRWPRGNSLANELRWAFYI